jgi:hypothetical protein
MGVNRRRAGTCRRARPGARLGMATFVCNRAAVKSACPFLVASAEKRGKEFEWLLKSVLPAFRPPPRYRWTQGNPPRPIHCCEAAAHSIEMPEGASLRVSRGPFSGKRVFLALKKCFGNPLDYFVLQHNCNNYFGCTRLEPSAL